MYTDSRQDDDDPQSQIAAITNPTARRRIVSEMVKDTMTDNVTPGSTSRRSMRFVLYGVGIVIIGFVLIQLVRFIVPEFNPDNPPVTNTVKWDSPKTEQLWKQACADCHSNETVYPWYSYVAPVGWLVTHDVHEGRQNLNISVSNRVELDEIREMISEGEMPPKVYLPMHPEANLSDADKQALIDGLSASLTNRG